MSERPVETSGNNQGETPSSGAPSASKRVRRTMLSTGFSDVPGKTCEVCDFQGFRWQMAPAMVAIKPAPFRGVLPLPILALKSALPVIGNPRNRDRAVPLTLRAVPLRLRQRRQREGGEGPLRHLRRSGLGLPLFQAATANLKPWTEAKVNSKNPARGPMLTINGERTTTVPRAIANASHKRRKRNEGGPRCRCQTGATPSWSIALAGACRHGPRIR
jgi:hypothetical protein